MEPQTHNLAVMLLFKLWLSERPKSSKHFHVDAIYYFFTNDFFSIVSYKAEFDSYCCNVCTTCCLDKPRKYFYVLENGYEKNDAFYVGCCMSMDGIYKTYFDRGIYDMQSCSQRMGCVRGAAQIHPGNGKS
jgi:hypothetical protein